MKSKNVVVVGSGKGISRVLSGLKVYKDLNLTAIVSMADSGGCSGKLRRMFGAPPMGDLRKVLVSLAPESVWKRIFEERFTTEGYFDQHSKGNIILVSLYQAAGLTSAVEEAARKLLHIPLEHTVVPVTLDNVELSAVLEDGTVVKGEDEIDVPKKHDGSLRITEVRLEPQATANPQAVEAIKNADAIMLGPGDLYTSIIPNLLVEGIVDAIKGSVAQKIYIMNIMTKYGETNNFSPTDFITTLEQYLGSGVVNNLVVNTGKPTEEVLERYHKENSSWVDYANMKISSNYRVVADNLLSDDLYAYHDPTKTAKVLYELLRGEAEISYVDSTEPELQIA